MPVAFEELAPVPGKVDPTLQTLKIARWEDFMATVSPVLGYREGRLTGLVIKDYDLKPKPGMARLQGMAADKVKGGIEESGWEVSAEITAVRSMTLKEVKDRVRASKVLGRAAEILDLPDVESLRKKMDAGLVTEDMAATAGFKTVRQFKKELAQEIFTHADAYRYGFAGVADMQSKLSQLFVDDKVDPSAETNRLHFIDFNPVDKSSMVYHKPARRALVEIAGADGTEEKGKAASATAVPPAAIKATTIRGTGKGR